jgi:hypothetical protein
MEHDKTEELQRSIDALLAKIEEQKRTIGWLLRDSGPRLVYSAAPAAIRPWSAAARRPRDAMTLKL